VASEHCGLREEKKKRKKKVRRQRQRQMRVSTSIDLCHDILGAITIMNYNYLWEKPIGRKVAWVKHK
jgi:hypothetical protein